MKSLAKKGPHLMIIFLALLIIPLARPMLAGIGPEVTVIYTGDLQGELYPTPEWSVVGIPKPVMGGLDRIAALIRGERSSGPCLVLDAGDFALGSPEANQSQGRITVDLLSRLGYDAICVGERDLPALMPRLDSIAQTATYRLLGDPLLGARASVDMPVVRRSLLREVGGVKVGIIGIMDDQLLIPSDDSLPLSSGIPLEEIVARETKALRVRGAVVVIVLAHMGVERCCNMAERITGVTAFVCAHEGVPVERVVRDGRSLVLAAGRRGRRVGVLRIRVDSAQGTIVQMRNHFVNMLAGSQSDSDLRLALERHRLLGQEDSIASSDQELLPTAGKYSPLGQSISACLRHHLRVDAVVLDYDVLGEALPKGALSRRQLAAIAPFDDTLVLLKANNSLLRDIGAGWFGRTSHGALITCGIRRDSTRSESLPEAIVALRKAQSPTASIVMPLRLALEAGIPRRDYTKVRASIPEIVLEALRAGTFPYEAGLNPDPWGQPSKVNVASEVSSEPLGQGKESKRINVNTADTTQLATLPGIGPKLAAAIVRYRSEHGPFRSAQDLLKVKGIGPVILGRIRDRIAF